MTKIATSAAAALLLILSSISLVVVTTATIIDASSAPIVPAIVAAAATTATATATLVAPIQCDGPEKYVGNNVTAAFFRCCLVYESKPKRITILDGDWYIPYPPLLISCDNIEVQFATASSRLIFPSSPYDWNNAKFGIGAIGRSNISIIGASSPYTGGGGTINGGATRDGFWRDCTVKRPHLLSFTNCKGVRVANVTLTNSPMFHLVGTDTTNVHVDRVKIQAPYTSKSCNLDGIDFTNSSTILVERSVINSGDDNVAIKENCHHVLVRSCVFGTGHGASIGSIRHGNTYNVTFENIIMDGPDNGCRIKTWRDGTGTVHDIAFKNITMSNTARPIIIDTDYHDPMDSPPVVAVPVAPVVATAAAVSVDAKASSSSSSTSNGGVYISRIIFSDIYAGRSRSPATIQCQSDAPCTAITVANVQLDVPIKCAYASGKSIAPLSPSSMANCITPA